MLLGSVNSSVFAGETDTENPASGSVQTENEEKKSSESGEGNCGQKKDEQEDSSEPESPDTGAGEDADTPAGPMTESGHGTEGDEPEDAEPSEGGGSAGILQNGGENEEGEDGISAASESPMTAANAQIYNIPSVIDKTAQYQYTTVSSPVIGSVGGEWVIIGLARSGRSVPSGYYSGYYSRAVKEIQDSRGILDRNKFTEYSRVILALTSLGYDVTDAGGYDLTYYLTDYQRVIYQGINGPVWALIALDSGDYELPARSDVLNANRKLFIDYILDREITKNGVRGGWSLDGSSPDPDITFMAVQGLAKYYQTDPEVKAAVDRALSVMSSAQNSDGGFSSVDGASCESTAQAVVGLCALGIDPDTDPRFVKNGNSIIDALMSYSVAVPDGLIAFRHLKSQTKPDPMATDQALYALVAYERFTDKKNFLYDMTDIIKKPDNPEDSETLRRVSEVIDKAAAFQFRYVTAPSVNSVGGEWTVIGTARSGRNAPDRYYENYYSRVLSTIRNNNGILDRNKYTEYSRVILALTAIDKDVKDAAGYDLTYYLADYKKVIYQGINGPIWALIALDSANYEIPFRNDVEINSSRELFINYILDNEITKNGVRGGWSLDGTDPDPDITFMAVQGLARYYSTDPRVKAAADRALNVMSGMQTAGGGFKSWGSENSESVAQAIVALCALGIDPEKDDRFIKNGRTLIDSLLAFTITDSSGYTGFVHIAGGREADGIATDQGLYALAAYERLLKKQTFIYDMTDVRGSTGPENPPENADTDKVNNVVALINALGEVTLDSKPAIDRAMSAYNALNAAEKKLVTNYIVLVNAVLKYDELLKDSTEPQKAAGVTKSLGMGDDVSNDPNTKYVIDSFTQSVIDRIIRLNELMSSGAASIQSSKNMIIQVTRDYLSLTQVQKLFVGNSYVLDSMLLSLKTYTHNDQATGIKVSNLAGYIQLSVSEATSRSEYRDFENALGGLKLLKVYDISLVDLTSMEVYLPSGSVTLSVPEPDFKGYDGVVLACFTDDGKLIFINSSTDSKGMMNAQVVNFTRIGVVGYNGENPLLLTDAVTDPAEKTVVSWPYAVMLAGGIFLAAVLVTGRKRFVK